MFLIINRGGRRGGQDDDVLATSLAWLMILLVITVAAPVVWWVQSRDAGHGHMSSAITAISVGGTALSVGAWIGWWAAGLTGLVLGLAGLVAISEFAKADIRRMRREMAEEERDWQSQN